MKSASLRTWRVIALFACAWTAHARSAETDTAVPLPMTPAGDYQTTWLTLAQAGAEKKDTRMYLAFRDGRLAQVWCRAGLAGSTADRLRPGQRQDRRDSEHAFAQRPGHRPAALPPSQVRTVAVNGKPWTEFNKDKETIALEGLTGAVAVTAQY